MAYSEIELLRLMEGWRDTNLDPEDINQPKEYQEIRNHYLQNVSATPQGPGTPALSYGAATPAQSYWDHLKESASQAGYRIGEDVADEAVSWAETLGFDKWADEQKSLRGL